MSASGLITADKRMSLSAIAKTGTKPIPPRIMIYGPQKIGKSTFGANAPAPIFIPIEDGLHALKVDAFPQATCFQDVLDAMEVLATQPHEYRTVIVDSLDWLEALIWRHTCEVGGKSSIEDFGYGKGYVEALKHWRTFLDCITGLRDMRGMASILIAHSQIRKFEAPDKAGAWDRYQPKLNEKAGALVQEAVDVIGLAMLDANVVKVDAGFNKEKAKAVGEGRRVLHLAERPAYMAGSRYRLPPTIDLSWEAFAEAFRAATSPQPAAESQPAAA